ncbi:hypothetical protein H2201_004963 [Coniosporium apollinis]|uniref:non-specific serine/threonine protein kinase n=1 Tax=Coniosporium apollinis TaxID=61459 RepID=A0ABQ9NV45_9PEZI|nr:hypothetical protein H2201_004963 [Coniosporium apollinis]
MSKIQQSQSNSMEPSTTPEPNAFDKDYERVSVIGKGGEGQAILCRHKTSSQVVVAKLEAMILRDLRRHDHIVGYLGAFNRAPIPSRATILLEYCSGGDLHDLTLSYRRSGVSIPEPFLWHVFRQLSQALTFLHSGNATSHPGEYSLIHRDIKPENVPLAGKFVPDSPYPYPSVKLADFGLAVLFQPGKNNKDYGFTGGTPDWQPPETPIATPAGNMWSVSAIIHFLALARPPIANLREFRAKYSDADEIERMDPNFFYRNVPREVTQICALTGHEYSGKFGDHAYSRQLNTWMSKALAENPKERKSLQERHIRLMTIPPELRANPTSKDKKQTVWLISHMTNHAPSAAANPLASTGSRRPLAPFPLAVGAGAGSVALATSVDVSVVVSIELVELEPEVCAAEDVVVVVTVCSVEAVSLAVDAKPLVADARTLEAEDSALAMTDEMLERTAEASLLADAATLEISLATDEATDVTKPDAVETALDASLTTELAAEEISLLKELATDDASLRTELAADVASLAAELAADVTPPITVVPADVASLATELAIEDASLAIELAAELMALDAAPGAVEIWLAMELATDEAALSAEE